MRIFPRLLAALAGIAVLTPAAPLEAVAVIVDSLVIRVYDNAGVLAMHRSAAVRRARSVLWRADVKTEWLECPAAGAGRRPAACGQPPARGELIVRLVNSPPSPGDVANQTVGYSLIDGETGVGTLATVFVDRVEALSRGARVRAEDVLGLAIAHEIGHLLLGTNAHSPTGLMRAAWTVQELARNRLDDWRFSSEQRDQIAATRRVQIHGTDARGGERKVPAPQLMHR